MAEEEIGGSEVTPDIGAQSEQAEDSGTGSSSVGEAVRSGLRPGAPTEGIRDLQSERDRLKGQMEKLHPLAQLSERYGSSPEEVARFVEQMLPIAQRADFSDYVRREQARSNGDARAEEPEDDLRSEEEKRLDSLSTRFDQMSLENRLERAEVRFEKAEKDLEGMYGDIWQGKRGEVLERLRQMISSGLVKNPDDITPFALNQAFLASFRGMDEFRAFMTKAVQGWEGARLEHQRGMETRPPSNEKGEAQRRRPRTPREAIRLGFEDFSQGTPQR